MRIDREMASRDVTQRHRFHFFKLTGSVPLIDTKVWCEYEVICTIYMEVIKQCVFKLNKSATIRIMYLI